MTARSTEHAARPSGTSRLLEHDRHHASLPLSHALLLISACACLSGCPVTAQDDQDPTLSGFQSEAVMQIRGTSQNDWDSTITYNDWTSDPSHLAYDQQCPDGSGMAERVVWSGFSSLGWSWRDEAANQWTHMRADPLGTGIAMLWGDPAIVHLASPTSEVYIANLTVPTSKLPNGYFCGDIQDNYLGGAAIYRSSDSGHHFVFYQYLTDSGNHFFDGSTFATWGATYAGFRNTFDSTIATFCSSSAGTAFSPFFNPATAVTFHPRFRVDPILLRLYEMYASVNELKVARTVTAGCSSPSWNFPSTVETNLTTGRTVSLAPIRDCSQNALKAWRIDNPGPTYADETADFGSTAANDVQPFPASETIGDQFAIGFGSTFNKVTITTGTAGAGGTLAWKYWNGTAWTALSGVNDGTNGFKVSGAKDVSWTIPTDWATKSLNGSASSYYVVAEVTGLYSTNPLLSRGQIAEKNSVLLLGPQYSFDVGWGENGAQELRYMYTAKISGVYRILGGWCTMPSGSANMVCTHEPAWTGHTVPGQSDYPGDQFNPIVKYGDGRWIVSYHTRQDDPSGNTVSIWEAQLVRTPTASSTKAQVVPAQTVCSRCDGYWGDYDEIAYAGINPDNQQRVFYRPYTDSSRGCTARRNYYATDMHVSVAPISVQ